MGQHFVKNRFFSCLERKQWHFLKENWRKIWHFRKIPVHLAAMTLIADSIPLMRFRTRRREVRFWICIFWLRTKPAVWKEISVIKRMWISTTFPFHLIEPYRIILGFKYTWTCRKAVIMTSPYMMNMAIRSERQNGTGKDVKHWPSRTGIQIPINIVSK